MNEDEAAFQQLKWAVQALAASADDQAHLYPSFACPACELLLDFDDWHRATVWRKSLAITTDQRKALDSIQAQIDSMEETPCFSTVAIRDRADWQRLRDSASRCLELFGWERDLPPDRRSEFVPGG
jgi:hypothetical protein